MAMVKVNGVDLYYEVHGDGEPLVLISGLAADHTGWAHLLPVFSKKYRTIVLDNRGVGQTVIPDGPFTVEDVAEDISGLLDALNIKKAIIVGVSMGGFIAQALAIRHPEQVKGLILCSTSSRPSPRSWFALRTLNEGRDNGKIDLEYYVKMSISLIFSDDMFAKPDVVKTTVSWMMTAMANTVVDKRQGQFTRAFDFTPMLGGIKAPTLVILGDEDFLFPISCGKELAASIPNAKLVVLEGGSHMAYVEMADKFIPPVMGFLAGMDENAGAVQAIIPTQVT